MAALVLGVPICGNSYKLPAINQTLFILAKTVVEFIRPLVAITYKHDSLYTWQRLQSICMNPLFFPSDRVLSNQIATHFTGATERHHGL